MHGSLHERFRVYGLGLWQRKAPKITPGPKNPTALLADQGDSVSRSIIGISYVITRLIVVTGIFTNIPAKLEDNSPEANPRTSAFGPQLYRIIPK